MSSTPTVGRIVHYVSRGSADGFYKPQCRAAIITHVNGWFDPSMNFVSPGTDDEFVPGDGAFDCALTVFNPEGQYLLASCRQDEEKKAPGTWHWPERAKA